MSDIGQGVQKQMSINRLSSLFLKASSDFVVPLATPVGYPTLSIKAGELPLAAWPNGSTCFEANCWASKLLNEGLQSPSIAEYFYQITPFLRYCSSISTDLPDVNNAIFVNFMDEIKKPESIYINGSSLSLKRIKSIANRTLDFLEHVGEIYFIADFVSSNGKIQARKVETKSNGRTRFTWRHPKIPKNVGPSSGGKPISEKNISLIIKAARQAKSEPYYKSRNRIITEILKGTGSRRAELPPITLGHIKAARKRPIPALELANMKSPNKPIKIPEIEEALLLLIENYVTYDLLPFLSCKRITASDATPLFVSNKTGHALTPNSITKIFHALRKIAKIEEPVYPHQFRHRSITLFEKNRFAEHPAEFALSRVNGGRPVSETSLHNAERHGHASVDSQKPYNHFNNQRPLGEFSNPASSLYSPLILDNLQIASDILESKSASRRDRQKALDLIKNSIASLEKASTDGASE